MCTSHPKYADEIIVWKWKLNARDRSLFEVLHCLRIMMKVPRKFDVWIFLIRPFQINKYKLDFDCWIYTNDC